MVINFSTKVLSLGVLAFGLISTAFGQTITPTRVGPVSQYGQLMTGKNSQGQGRIYGDCEGVKDGAEVQVKGMSLYWSLVPQAVEFWSEEGVTTMVNDMNIQIVRAAMATGNEDWSNGYKGYGSDPTTQMNLMKTVVEAAIKNDIYVIIDWHSHNANEQTEAAKNFFKEMAQTYGQYDNVIFELFNEPTDIAWGVIKNYADQVIPVIRKYSDNLILVGTPKWDQNPQVAIGNEVNDSKNNTAYTLHYYANSHCWSGTYDWGGACEGTNGEQAINAGLSVFVSEWGTADASGDGNPDKGRNASWQEFVDKHKLSWANWSASTVSEGTAAFLSGATKTSLQYTTSGNMVKGYLASNPTSYTACREKPVQSSSSMASSSSVVSSSSEVPPPSSSSAKVVTVFELTSANAVQTVYAGEFIQPIVYRFENITQVASTGKLGLKGTLSSSAKTYTVSGLIPTNTSTGDYDFEMDVAGPDTTFKVVATIKVERKPVKTTVELVSGNVGQIVVAGDSIEPLVFRYEYMDSVKASGLPEGNISLMVDTLEQLITLAGAVDKELTDYEYTLTLDVFGPNNNTSASVKINVIAPKSSSSVVSSSSAESSSSEVPEESSSSEEVVESSSSEEPVESSSSEEPEVSSSSEVPEESSSSEEIVESSSSEEPVESSSSEEPVLSSSSEASAVVVVTGEIEQTVKVGESITPVTFENVDKYSRNWGMYYLEFSEISDGKFTVTGTVPAHIEAGTYTEKITIAGSEYAIVLKVESEHTTFAVSQSVNPMTLSVEGRMLHIGGAEWVNVNVFDLQGRPMASFKQVKNSVSLDMLHQGNYIVQVRTGSNSLIKRVAIK